MFWADRSGRLLKSVEEGRHPRRRLGDKALVGHEGAAEGDAAGLRVGSERFHRTICETSRKCKQPSGHGGRTGDDYCQRVRALLRCTQVQNDRGECETISEIILSPPTGSISGRLGRKSGKDLCQPREERGAPRLWGRSDSGYRSGEQAYPCDREQVRLRQGSRIFC